MSETYSELTTSVDPRPMFNGGPRQRSIDTIVVHHNATTNKDVALNTWLVSSGNWTSAHYEITDNEIIGAVGENYVAYHAGGTGGSDVPKISDPNGRSIGLEHVNSSGDPNWEVSEATLRNSARLIADICKRYSLPIDRSTIKLHREITSTACPGGLDIDKLVQYAREAAGQPVSAPAPAPVAPAPSNQGKSAMQVFKDNNNVFVNTKSFRVDDVKFVYGQWQMLNYALAGDTNANWLLNGIPLSILDNVTRGNNAPTQIGDQVKFSAGYDRGTIDEYDEPSNGVGIVFKQADGIIWFDADAFIKL